MKKYSVVVEHKQTGYVNSKIIDVPNNMTVEDIIKDCTEFGASSDIVCRNENFEVFIIENDIIRQTWCYFK